MCGSVLLHYEYEKDNLYTHTFVLALVACHPEPEPIQPTPEKPDFEITINGTTRGSVTFSVEPKDMDLCVSMYGI